MSEDFDRAYWEQRYRDHAAVRDRRPNPQLVAEAADLVPGRVLDAGCGEGADAIWLAARGWRVTAVDISATALGRARATADALGPGLAGRIEWIESDLTERAPTAAGFDLVSAQYVHAAGPREALFRLLAAAVAPGGTLLVVGHDPSDGHGDGAHAPATGSHVTAGEVAAALDRDRWDVVVAEARRHTVPGPHGHGHGHGHGHTMSDAVLRARRRA